MRAFLFWNARRAEAIIINMDHVRVIEKGFGNTTSLHMTWDDPTANGEAITIGHLFEDVWQFLMQNRKLEYVTDMIAWENNRDQR